MAVQISLTTPKQVEVVRQVMAPELRVFKVMLNTETKTLLFYMDNPRGYMEDLIQNLPPDGSGARRVLLVLMRRVTQALKEQTNPMEHP